MVNQEKPRVAIFGGSFDPPHLAHQQIVTEAIKNLDIDKLLVVPTYLNPFKSSSLASASKRLEWCHTLFDTIEHVYVDDYEIKQNKSTFTSQTVKHFNKQYDVKYLIIGSDNLSSLTKWNNFEWLNNNITWVVVTRKNYDVDVSILKEWKILTVNTPVSSTHIRDSKVLDHVDTKIKKSVQNVLEG